MFPQKHKITAFGPFYARLLYLIGLAVFCFFALAFLPSNRSVQTVEAATSSNLNFQARIYNPSGSTVPDGYYNIEFKLYNVASGGSSLWSEAYYDSNGVTAGNDNRLRVVNGYFSVNLGSQTAFGNLNWDQEMWLTMNVGGSTQTATPSYDGEMNPRIKLTAVPYAFRAGALQGTAGAYTADDLVQLAPATIQGVNSANNAVRVNQTGAGGLLQLQSSGTDQFTISNTGVVTATGTGTFQGASLTVGTVSQSGSLILNDGSSNTVTLSLAAQGQNSVITIPDPGAGTDTVCLQGLNNCAGASVTLQSAYTASTGSTTPEIKLDSTRGALDIQDADSSINGSLLTVRASNGSGLGSALFDINSTGQTTFKNSVDSTTALQVQNAAGSQILNIDTTTSNLISNPSFETNTTGWTASGAGSISRITTQYLYGNASLQLTTTSSGDGVRFPVTLNNSTTYQLIMYVKLVSGSSVSSANQMGRSEDGSTDSSCATNSNIGSTIGWYRLICSFTTGTVTGSPYVYFKQTDGNARTLAIDGVQLIASSTASAYKEGSIALNGVITTPVILQAASNTTQALEVRRPDASVLFVADTTNNVIGIGQNAGAGKLSISNSTSGIVGLRVTQSAANNILELINGSTTTFTVSNTGTVLSQNTSNNANAFQVQNAAGAQLFNIDSANNNITLLGNNSGELQAWNTTTALSSSAANHVVTSYNGYIYYANATTVRYAKINGDGTIGSWSSATTLPTSNARGALIPANGYIYSVGGNGYSSSVYYAKANPDGSLGSWNTTTSLPEGRQAFGSVFANGYIYVIGGEASGPTLRASTYYARVNADGTVGTWNTTSSLTTSKGNFQAVQANGYVYAIGGYAGSASTNVQYAKLNNDGTLGSWTNTTSLSDARHYVASVALNGYVYAIGGSNTTPVTGGQATVMYAPITSTGAIGSWTTGSNSLPGTRSQFQATTANGYVYVLGGTDSSSTQQTTVYYSSGPRIRVGGSLDLVGLSGQNLSEAGDFSSGGAGGTLTAGNTTIVGSLNVMGQSSFTQGVAINKELRVGGSALFQNASNTANAFQVQNAAGTTLINVDNTSEAANLVTNGSFDQNTTGWTAAGAATLSSSTAQQIFGQGSLLITTTAAANDGARYAVTLSPSTAYSLTFYVRASSSAPIAVGRSDDGSTETNCTTTSAPTTGWYKVNCGWTTGGSISSSFIYIKQTDTTARSIYVDGVHLYASNTSAGVYSESRISLNGTINTPLILQPTVNSNSTFDVYYANGGSFFNLDTQNNAASFWGNTFQLRGSSTTELSVGNNTNKALLVDTTNTRAGINVSSANLLNTFNINNATTADSAATALISTGGTGNKGLVIQGVASQSANLLEVQTSSGASGVVASIGATGAALFKNSSNSTTAFQVQNADGTNVLGIDTTYDSTNLVTNGSIEVNATGYTATGSATVSRTTGEKLYGNASLQVATTAAANDGVKYPVGLSSTTTYILSFFAKTSSGTLVIPTTIEVGRSDNGSTDTACSGGTSINNTTWGYFTCTFTTGSVSGSPYVYIKQVDATSRSIYIDGVRLETGSANGSFYREARLQLNGVVETPLLLQNTVNSDYAFGVKQANGTILFAADTKNGVVNVGPNLNPVAKLNVVNATSSIVGLYVNQQQTATDIVRFQSNGTSVVTVGGTGATTFRNQTNSTSAFQIQDSAGTSNLFVADTTNSRIGIGRLPTNGYQLQVAGSISTDSNLALNSSSTSAGTLTKVYVVGTGDVTINDVVVLDSSAQAVRTTTARDSRILGIATASVTSTNNVAVAINGNYQVTATTGAVAIGDQLVTSTTSGQVSVDNNATTGILGIATTAKAGGSSGLVGVSIGVVRGQYSPRFQNASDSTTAFQIQNSAGTSNLFIADTTNSRLYVNTNTGTRALNVNGDVGISGSALVFEGTGAASGGIAKNYTAGTGGYSVNDVLVLADDSGNLRSMTTTTARDVRVLGVARTTVSAGNSGSVIISGTTQVTADIGAVAIGDQLVTSTTTGQVTVDNNATTGILGTAISAKAGGSSGLVWVNVRPIGGQYSPVFRNASNSTTAFQIQNAAGNSFITADSANTQLVLGKSSTIDGKIVLYSASNTGSITLNTANPGTSNYTITLPGETGTICTTAAAGACSVAGSGFVQFAPGSAQSDSTTNDSIFINKTGVSGNLINLQKTGTTVFSVGNSGQALFRQTSNSSTAFQVQNASGSQLFNIDSTNSNLLTNPSFETNTTGWSAAGAAAISRVTTPVYIGNGALQVTTTAAANDGVRYPYALASSTTYTITFEARLSSGTFTTLQVGRSDDGSTDTSCATATVSTGTWTRFNCSFTTGTTSGSPYIYFKQTDATLRTFYLDAVQLLAGNVVTNPYTEGTISLNGVINSPVAFQNTSNSTAAFTIQNSGGSSVLSADTTNNRVTFGSGSNYVQTDGANGRISLSNSSAFNSALLTQQSGDSNARFGLYYSGGMEWGSGSAVRDLNLVRAAAGVLQVSAPSGTGAATLRVKGTAAQSTTNLLEVQPDGSTTNMFSIGATGALTSRNSSDSTTAFQILNAAGTSNLTVDTTNSRIYVGNPTADAVANFLVIDTKNTSGDPAGVDGAMYYNSNSGRFRCYEAGAWIDCVGAGLGATLNLQTAYTNSAGGTTPEIKVDSTRGGLDIQDADSTINGNLLTVRASNGGGLGSALFSVNSTGQTLLQNSTNSTSAFRIQNASSSNLFVADTTNMNIGIGTSTPFAQFTVAGKLPSAAAGSVSVGASQGPINAFSLGRYVYVTDFDGNNFKIIDVSDPASPAVISTRTTGTNPVGIYVAGRYAYVANRGSDTLTIYDVSNPANVPAAVGSIATDDQPYDVFVSGRYAYVVNDSVGSSTLRIYDVTNPATPVQTGTLTLNSAVARSVYVQGNYAYIVTQPGIGELEIVDISNPASPTSVATENAGAIPYKIIVNGRYAYISKIGGSPGIEVFDVSDPTTPVLVDGIATDSAIDFEIQGRYIYLTNFNSNTLEVIDIADPNNMTSVGTVTTGTNPRSVVMLGRYAYVANYGSDSVQAFDMGGAYIQQLEVGGIETTTIHSTGVASFGNDVNVVGSLNLGGGAFVGGNLGVNGQALFQNQTDSTSAFQVQQANGTPLFNVDTSSTGAVALGYYSGNAILTVSAAGGVQVETTGNSAWTNLGTSNSANILNLYNASNNSVGSVSATGAVLFNNSSDSANAFRVQNSSSANLINVNTSSNAIDLGSVGTSTYSSTTNIGNTSNGTGTQTVNIGSTANASNAVLIQGGTGASAISLQAGSGGTIGVGSSATAQTLNIGNTTGATALNLRTGTGNFTLDGVAGTTYTLGASTTTGTFTLGGTAQTGNIVLGSSSGTNSVLIGNGAGATTVNIANANTAGAVNIGAAFTTGTITVGGTAQTGNIVLGQSTATNTISIGGGNTATGNTQTINIGAGTPAGTGLTNVTIGNSVNAGSTTINSATTNINSSTIATTATSLSLFNTNAATVTALQAGTSISLGATTGTLTVRNANQTFGNAAGSGVFTNNGATVNTTLAVTNDADGGALGGGLAASASVDVYGSISIAQTTASQTITLPSPTATTAYGRTLYISNIGSTSFTMLGVVVNTGTTITLVWSNTNGGASWQVASTGGASNVILNQNASDQTANFRISGTGRANTSFTAPLFDSITGTLGIGTTTATGITIGNTANTATVDIQGTTGAAYTLGSNATTGTITIGGTAQTGNITLGSSSGTNNVNIGAGAGATTVNISNANTAGAVNIGAAFTTGTITIGGTGAQTGTISIGVGTGAQALNFGTGGTGAKTVTIGSTASTSSTTINSGTGNIDIGTTAQARATNVGTGAAAQTVTIGSQNSTSSLTLDSGTGAINLGTGAQARTINLGTGAAAQAVTVGSTNTTSALTLQAGTGGLNITTQGTGALNVGNNAVAQTLNIGNTTGATALNLRTGTGNFTLDGVAGTTYTLGASTTTGTFTLGGTAQTGNIVLGSSSGTNSVLIGNGAGATTVSIANANTAGAVNIGAAFTTGTITVGGTAQTGNMILGQSTATNTISIGSSAGNGNTQTINIGTSATAGSTTNVNIGSAINGSTIVKGNSATAFQVQNAASANLLTVDATGSGNISLLANNNGALNGWTTNGSNLAISASDGVVASYNGYIYYVSGYNSGSIQDDYQYARLNADGSTGSWTNVTSNQLPGVRYAAGGTAVNGYMYIIGGSTTTSSTNVQTTVYYARINADGTLGAWQTNSNSICAGVYGNSVVSLNGYIYSIGGMNSGGTQLNATCYAKLNADGSTGAWTTTGTLPANRAWGSVNTANGFLYFVGGMSPGTANDDTYYGTITPSTGAVSWSTVAGVLLPTNRATGALGVMNGYLYYVAGDDLTNSQDDVYYAALNANGTIGAWSTDGLLTANRSGGGVSAVVANGYIYYVGGSTGGTQQTSVYYASGARVRIGGNLDLVGLSGENLNAGGSGGNLTAGNTRIIGTLDVQGDSAIRGNLFAGGNVTIRNGTNSTSAFQIQNASGTTIFSADTTNSRIGINTSTASYDLSFGGDSARTIGLQTRSTNAAGSALTISAGTAGAGGSAFAGGTLTLQGGSAGGTGNANGGDVTITGGAGTGSTGYQGLVNLSSTAFSTAPVQTISSTGVQAVTAGNQNIYSTLPITASVTGVIATLGDPGQSVIGRILYVTARSGSNDFTLRLNSARTPIDITMKANSTATLIWNGTDWTAAGASSSTDLQAAYNNTVSSAGGAELILNAPGGAADGLTIRNNGTTPITGGLLEVQTSIGSNLLTVNNNATEYANNGGAESTTFTMWTDASAGALETTGRDTSNVATGQGSVSIATTAVAAQGVKNTLSSALTNSLEYQVSFTAKAASTGFSTLDVMYSYDGTVANARHCVAGTPTYTGTASQSTTTITGTGFTAAMTGMTIVFANGQSSVVTYVNATTLTASISQTVSSQSYGLYPAGFTINTSTWTRVSCNFTAAPSGTTITSSNAIFIRQTDATSRTFYVDNLSVTVNADVNHAADGSVDNALGSNWTQFDADGGAGTTTVTRDTTNIYDTSGAVSDVTTAHVNEGVRNNMTISPSINTQYLVTFYAKSSNAFNDITVGFLPAGGNSVPLAAQRCADYNTQSVSTSSWTRITCVITTPGSGISDPDLVIYQPTATARTFYIDALTIALNTNNSSNVQIGGGNKGGPTTLFTLDRSNGAPIGANNDAYLGSMYYDTITGRIQCYEADGWGACGAAPDNIVNLNPEYAGAVLNGTGVGTMTADFCSNDTALSINSTLCSSGQAKNYYRWTSPQATQQTYSIYVTYQLPATFNGFSSDDTVQLVGRVDSTSNASVTYEMYKSTGSAVTQCGTGETNVITGGGGVADTWYSYGVNGNESTGCSFNSSSAGNFVIFKINLKANSNANAYVSTLSFTTTGR